MFYQRSTFSIANMTKCANNNMHDDVGFIFLLSVFFLFFLDRPEAIACGAVCCGFFLFSPRVIAPPPGSATVYTASKKSQGSAATLFKMW